MEEKTWAMDKNMEEHNVYVYEERGEREKGTNVRHSGFLEPEVSKYEVVRNENKEAGREVYVQLKELELFPDD